MESIKYSNFYDYNYNIPNISTFQFQNNISRDSSSLSIDENDSFSHYHDIEPISYSYNISIINKKLNDINQSTEEFLDNSNNEIFFPKVLNFTSNNQSFLHYPFPIPDINKNILNININAEINKNKEQPKFTIKKRIRKTNKNPTKKSERKYDKYNIKNKIQGYYSNILIELDKSVCERIGRQDLIFHTIERKYKVENTFIKNKKNNTIEDFFINGNDYNRNLCQKIREEKIQELIDILNQNYLFFFKKIFFAERKEKYRLKEFGLADIEIEIPNTIKLFNDLIEDNKNDKKYVKLLKESAKRNFFLEDNNISFKCKKCRK
jgi:hypothetical protein